MIMEGKKSTVCPRSSGPSVIVTYYIKWATTSRKKKDKNILKKRWHFFKAYIFILLDPIKEGIWGRYCIERKIIIIKLYSHLTFLTFSLSLSFRPPSFLM